MQLVGLPLLIFIIWFGFSERDFEKISAFDSHALIMVLVGCLAAILSSSSAVTAWRICSIIEGCSPSVGSSRSSTDGLMHSARPVASICCSPPDSVSARWFRRSRRRGNISSTCSRKA